MQDLDVSPFNLDFFVSGNAPLFQETFEHPFPSIPDEFHLSFPFGMQQDTSPLQLVRKHDLPAPPDVLGPSSFRPREITTPSISNIRNRGTRRKGLTEAGLWATRETHSPTAVPAIPPVRVAQSAPLRTSPSNTTQQIPSLPLAMTFPANWVMVPQGEYVQGRNQWSFKRREPVYFSECGHPGVNMGAALRETLENLDGRDDPMLQEASGAVSCRFLVISFVSCFYMG